MLFRRHRLYPLAVIALAALGGACAGTAVAPEDEVPTPPAEAETVGIVVEEDEIVLSGRLFGSDNEVGVILTHMRPADQEAWWPFAQELAERGYVALTFNFRGYGESQGEQDFATLDEDLKAALRYMRDRGWPTVFLVGASMGGSTALVVAGEEDVAGVVAVSAPAEFEDQDALAAVPRITEPLLLIAAEGDVAAMLSLEQLLEATGEPKESEVYTGNAHGTDLLQPDLSEHVAAVQERIIRFLEQHREP